MTPLAQGVKFDAQKPRMDLLDAYAIEQLACVLPKNMRPTTGAKVLCGGAFWQQRCDTFLLICAAKTETRSQACLTSLTRCVAACFCWA
jgi:hypothetical protein